MKYHKINSLWHRDEKKNFIEGEFSQPEFAYLYDKNWIGTEKIDGTNLRIYINYEEKRKYRLEGRDENSSIPCNLFWKIDDIMLDVDVKSIFGDNKVILYGEGYGKEIQKNGNKYIPNDVDFILFDVMVNNLLLERKNVDDIAHKLNIKSVPVLFEGTLSEAIVMVSGGFKSTIGSADAEGLVLVPECDLLTRRGERIITKLKTRDFIQNKREK